MLISYKRSQTSIILRVKILNSSVATGAGLTGLTSASTGLIISTIADNEATATAYTVVGSTIETITTLGTYAAPTATKCRFKEVDATNHKGVYEIQIADARFAVASTKSIVVSISGATNAAECDVTIPLVDLDPYNAVPKADLETIKTNPVVNTGTVTFPTTATLASTTNITAGTVTTATNVTTVNGLAANVLTATSIANGAITAPKFAAGAIDAAATAADFVTEIRNAITGGAYALNTSATGSIRVVDGTGTDEIDLLAGAVELRPSTQSSISSIEGNTSDLLTIIGTAGAGLTAIADQVWDEAIVGHLGAGSTGAALNAAGSAGDPWTTPLPGAYGSGTAGFIVGTNINATISSRSTHSAADVWAVTTRTLSSGAIVAATFGAGAIDASAIATGAITAAKFAAGAIDAAAIANGAIDAATFAAGAIDAAALAADAGTEIATAVWASATRVLTAGTNIVLAKGTGVTGFNDITVSSIWTTALVESYRTAGTVGTPSQYMHEILAGLLDHSISGTTKTIRNIAGAAAKTYTLDSSSAPTSITEAT